MYIDIRHIDQVRPVVEATDGEFYIAVKDGYSVANYAAVMSKFPEMSEGDHARILRECRGLIFCNETGKVLRRPLPKFFNYGEHVETRDVDFSNVVAVYDKLDGSMVVPFELNGELVWGTKMGLTHMAEDLQNFVDNHKINRFGGEIRNYHFFACEMIAVYNMSPIFEYMAPKHRIVVNHDKESMVLLAMRDINTGEFIEYEGMVQLAAKYDIPVVRRWEVDSNESLIDQVRDLEGAEGVVIEMRDGSRMKVKSLWYVDLHKNREAIAKEKYVVGLILNERIDDAIGLVPDFVAPRLEDYTHRFLKIYEEARVVFTAQLVKAFAETTSRKEFALYEGAHPLVKQIGFKLYDNRPQSLEPVFAEMFKERILALTEKSDKDFDQMCRHAVFKDLLPAWNIWDGTASASE